MKYKIKKSFVICLIFLLIIISSSFFLAKYRSNIVGVSGSSVAKWNNNIEIISDNTILLDDKKVNSETLTFNLLSSSEVKSKFNVNIDNVPNNIKLTLSNTMNNGSVLVLNNNITVSLNSSEETFTIPMNETVITINDITMTSTLITDGIDLLFTKNNSDISLDVKVVSNEDKFNVIFNDFGIVDKGDNQIVEHTIVFSTDAIVLPNISKLELYATFEQID
jgi:hypothetical protein